MQAGAKVITPQFRDLKIEQPKRVRTVHNHFNSPFLGHPADFLDGHNLTHPVDHMGYVDNFGFGRNGFFILLNNSLVVLNWKGKI